MWETEEFGQSLFSGLWGQDKGQWQQNRAQKVPHQHVKELIHGEGDGALGQAAQGGCGVSSGDIKGPSGHLPVQPALGKLL